MWTDPFVRDLGRVVRTTALLAAVRSGTDGMPYGEAAAAPFAEGRYLFSHNGALPGLAGTRPAGSAPSTCSAGGADRFGAAVAAGARPAARDRRLRAIADRRCTTSRRTRLGAATGSGRLNLLATDGRRIAATTWGDTLSWRADEHGVVVASEPFDDEPGWHDVPDRSVLTATPDGVDVRPLLDSDGMERT